MKKLFFLAATAMLFAACSNEEVSTPQLAQETADDGGVRFEVYVPGSTTAQTRAGRTNVMTTATLQKTGFGVLAYHHDYTGTDDAKYGVPSFDYVPDYMWNQQINYTENGGWYYAPLKYWPNETDNDSQTTPAEMQHNGSTGAVGTANTIDRLSFFAYAPWVYQNGSGVVSSTNAAVDAPANVGITKITKNDGTLANATPGRPRLIYSVATVPDQSVDLLWGVAPVGGLTYTSVAKDLTNGSTISSGVVSVAEGMPLVDLIKPAVNTNLKFMFQHALARLGVKVVLAADQVSAGGAFDVANTKVTIDKITIRGQFGMGGIMFLDNSKPNVAEWNETQTTKATGVDDAHPVLTIDATHGLAEHLRYDATLNPSSGDKTQQSHTGVTTTLADAIQVSSISDASQVAAGKSFYAKAVSGKVYSPTTPFFANEFEHTSSDYAPYNTTWTAATNTHYFQKNPTTGAYTLITPSITYPNATVWENIYKLAYANVKGITTTTEAETHKAKTAYRRVGNVFTPTGVQPEVGDIVFLADPSECKWESELGDVKTSSSGGGYVAVPNYFMVIPTNSYSTYESDDAMKTLTVQITYWVSTTDANLNNKVSYVQNVVEKSIKLPHFKNGVAYNLKLILGLTSVKLEAEVADWTTTDAEINLPQNTAE